ncbi:MAG TPA: uroporphyrinogen decarboxylase family protein [Clostridiales bacterium]|nr:MAG: Uroporphyrinogen decarboxylase (URO-D) [Firmicutes bacterium ADurb.Bin262]HOU10190.1 uroporphyrinogen decarboxylase family protein [Clostridiales bacterium]HQH62282.1 uroporphyrinogen decarboxylase family protein [Clostridiales bacterium]HQK72780.1 uroporphyrinogen decarboxylase family protein [Clostridiales bacterium]
MAIKPIRKKWKSEMTDRERFKAQMHYRPVDRCFNMEFGYWEENFTQWRIFRENGIKNNWQADAFFNFDRMETISGRLWLMPSFPHEVIEETESYRIVRNGDGLIAQENKLKSSIPHYIGSSVVTPDDWLKVKKEKLNPDNPERRFDSEDIEYLKEQHPPDRDYPLCIHCGSMIGKIRDMLTFEGLAYACFDYPEMVEDMVETCCRIVEDSLDMLLPHFDFDLASGWEDICFKNGPIVSVDFFEKVVMPRYKRIRKKLDEFGIDLWYTDCDGDVRPILPAMLEGGINCLFPFEVNGCAHPSVLFDEYGQQLRIMGGVDKMALGAGRKAIDDYLETLVPLVARGGYIPFCDHRCPPNVTEDDYLYYLDRKEELFGLK